jgi:hypothetical protein
MLIRPLPPPEPLELAAKVGLVLHEVVAGAGFILEMADDPGAEVLLGGWR